MFLWKKNPNGYFQMELLTVKYPIQSTKVGLHVVQWLKMDIYAIPEKLGWGHMDTPL
jgi:hypothetical protein